MKNEIYEIPFRAELCYNKNKGVILPEHVPYLGMGASNIATEVFRYIGIDILPEKAAEYYNYLLKYRSSGNGVLISQSGQSSETLWCADYFKSFVAIINNPESELGRHVNCKQKIFLHSGSEEHLAAKTYINTLLILFLGFGFDPHAAIRALKGEMSYFEQIGTKLGEVVRGQMRWNRKPSIYVLGNGPNVATAHLGAMVLSSVMRVPVQSMSVSNYDHAFVETAKNALVIALIHNGPEKERTKAVLKTVKHAGGKTFEFKNSVVDSLYSPITFPMAFYFAAAFLANKLKLKSLYQIGSKVTQVMQTSNKTE